MSDQPKPDFTAWFVMQGIIAAMRHPRLQNIRDNATLALYSPLSDDSKKTRTIIKIATRLPYTWQYRIQEFVTNTGRLKFFCFRKREIEKQARELLNAGAIKQVIVLGAGLDVLSLRLAPEYSAVKFIEIDTENSQNFKTTAFKNHDVKLPENVEYIAGDLRNPLPEILANSKFHDAQAKTLFIAEGFLMFIPEDSVVRIFNEIREISAQGSYVIFTTIPHAYPGKLLAQWLQKYVMRKENCPYAWAIAAEKIEDFIKRLGFTPLDCISYEKLQERDINPKKQQSKRLIEDIHIAVSANP
jgi:methyltransferase (TIGR00027 family)